MIHGAGSSSGEKSYQFCDENVAEGHSYYYQIESVSTTGGLAVFGPVLFHVSGGPDRTTLDQNYPNPFNNQTTIGFDLVRESRIKLDVYTVSGEHVCSLLDARWPAVRYSVLWNGKSDTGHPLASGTYVVKMTAGKSVLTKMMVLLK